MSAGLWLLLGVLLCASWIVYQGLNAADGWEDDNGTMHLDEPPAERGTDA